MYVVLILTLLGLVCGGEYNYPRGGNINQQNGGPYPQHPVHPGPINPPIGGPNYPTAGYPYPEADLDLPEDCSEIDFCIPEICMPPYDTCPNFPRARCVKFCNGCVARFFMGRVHVTPYCH